MRESGGGEGVSAGGNQYGLCPISIISEGGGNIEVYIHINGLRHSYYSANFGNPCREWEIHTRSSPSPVSPQMRPPRALPPETGGRGNDCTLPTIFGYLDEFACSRWIPASLILSRIWFGACVNVISSPFSPAWTFPGGDRKTGSGKRSD